MSASACPCERSICAGSTPQRPSPKPSVTPPKPSPKPPGPAPIEERLNNGIEGRIVQSYREGGDYILNLDKGESAGIRVGTEGTVLAGRSGRDPLPDGTFKVIKVIDGSHSQAKSGVRSIGRNNRVVFFKD